MTYQELQAAYDKLLQENERLRRVADDAREKLDGVYDSETSHQRLIIYLHNMTKWHVECRPEYTFPLSFWAHRKAAN